MLIRKYPSLPSSLHGSGARGVFLSLEVFELPWLLIALAGVLPAALKREFAQLDNAADARPDESRDEPVAPARQAAPAIVKPHRGLARI